MSTVSKLVLSCFLFAFLLPSCMFGWHRIYFTHSPDSHYALFRNIENSVFDRYSVNGTKFILLAEPYSFCADWKERNLVGGMFLIRMYRKPGYPPATYRLLKAVVNTSSFAMDVFDTEKNEAVFDFSEASNRPDGYAVGVIRSNYYRFPRPDDMKYSITVFIEEEEENGKKREYEFTYYFFLTKKDSWFRLIA